MRYWLALCIFALAVCFVPTGSARALHSNVSVTIVPADGGSVKGCDTSPPERGGLDCLECDEGQGTCAVGVCECSAINLTAYPAPGRVFGGWSGDCSGTGSCSLGGDVGHVVSASFDPTPPPPPPKFDLTVTKGGTGTGYVGGGGGIDCGPTCTASEGGGSKFQLVALADPGSVFTGWAGGCSGATPCDLTVTAAVSLAATFVRLPPKVRAIASTGVRGGVSELRYRLVDPNAGHREGMTVSQGTRVLAQMRLARTRLDDDSYFIRWHVPATLEPGTLSFCIIALDPTTHARAKSCARLRVT